METSNGYDTSTFFLRRLLCFMSYQKRWNRSKKTTTRSCWHVSCKTTYFVGCTKFHPRAWSAIKMDTVKNGL